MAVPGGKSLKQFAGYIQEEFHKKLEGPKACKVFREMADNDAALGGFQAALEALVGATEQKFDPADDTPEAKVIAERFEKMRGDMASTWPTVVTEILQAAVYGRALLVPLYKICRGPQDTLRLTSKYDDGVFAWRDWSPRPPESIERHEFSTDPDDDGAVLGFWQRTEPDYRLRYIPRSRVLLFRFKSRKDNPEGRSLYRNAYPSWYRADKLEIIEAIGIERMLAGLPVMEIPMQFMDKNASADNKATRKSYEDFVAKLRQDNMAGVVIPSSTIPGTLNASGYKLTLLNGGARSTANTDVVIKRYQSRMLLSVLAQLLLLGQDKVGSFALADSHMSLLALAIDRILTSIDEVINREAVPMIMKLNGWEEKLSPVHTHGPVDEKTLTEVAAYYATLTQSGGIVPCDADEEWLRSQGGLPPRKKEEGVETESGTKSPLTALVGGITGFNDICQAYTARRMTYNAASEALRVFFQMDDEGVVRALGQDPGPQPVAAPVVPNE